MSRLSPTGEVWLMLVREARGERARLGCRHICWLADGRTGWLTLND
jgi:hypothetical protein